MSIPIVLEYLKDHSFAELYEEHGVKARASSDGTVYSLNYDQLTVKNGEQISNECRGMVIVPRGHVKDENQIVGICDILARPFDRFYNLGDPCAADIDFSTAVALDKLDGTMIALYWSPYKKSWQVATRSVPEADMPMNDFGLTFNQLFWRGLFETIGNKDVHTFLDNLQKNLTFIFELTSPHNRIVCKYEETRVTLLGVRDTISGDELALKHGSTLWGVPVVSAHELDILDPDSVQAFVKTFSPDKNEGVVLKDAEGRRVEVKSPAYVLSHRFTDALRVSRRDILLAVLDGTMDDVLPLLDSHVRRHVDDLQSRLVRYFRETDARYQEFASRAKGDKKAFALAVQASGLWHPLFYELNKGKHSTTQELLTDWVAQGRVQRGLLDTMIQVLEWNPIV